jgi:hypothetical protein
MEAALATCNDKILIGNLANPHGYALIYRSLQGEWTIDRDLTVPKQRLVDYFGERLACSCTSAILSDYFYADKGAVYFFDLALQ